MNLLKQIWQSSLGKKYIMALTGAALFVFVVGHLVGNLQVFLGAEAINRYGHLLQSNQAILWPVRLGLLLVVGLHVAAALKLDAENRQARPVDYDHHSGPLGASLASRTMVLSGLMVAAFIIYHLLHYTVQVQAANLTGVDFHGLVDAQHRHDVYRMMILGFSHPAVSGAYIVAMGLLCLHLSHGLSSMFQSLGWKNQSYGPFLDRAALVVATLIFLGYISIPIAVLLGFGKEALK